MCFHYFDITFYSNNLPLYFNFKSTTLKQEAIQPVEEVVLNQQHAGTSSEQGVVIEID